MRRALPLAALTSAALLLAALLLAVCGSGDPVGERPTELVIRTDAGPVVLTVEIADEPEERATGLMGRTDLAEGSGMAFLWEEPVRATFWMKDTLIPLSIAFWDRSGRIVAILDMEPCGADPCPSYDAGVPFVGAVEVRRGSFERRGVEVGDRVELRAPDG